MADPVIKHPAQELDHTKGDKESALDTAISPSQKNSIEISADELSDLTGGSLETTHTIKRKSASQKTPDISRLQTGPHLTSLEDDIDSPDQSIATGQVIYAPVKLSSNSLLDQLMNLVVLFLEKIERLLTGSDHSSVKTENQQEEQELSEEMLESAPPITSRKKKKRRQYYR